MALIKKSPVNHESGERRSQPRDVQGLIGELASPLADARRWAAHDLAGHGSQVVTPLVEQLRIEGDPAVREAIMLGLIAIGDETAIAGLTECLRSEDAALRNEAIDVLRNLPDGVAMVMAKLLQDSDADVRIFAVNILDSLRHPEVETWLLAVINEDPHVNVCATAVDLLGEVGSQRAVSPLKALKQRFPDEPYIAFAADLALKRIGEGG
jgi:HEAT repeat protein